MAFGGNFQCTSFKRDLLCARHNFQLTGGHTFRIALYTNVATGMDATLTAYTATAEVVGAGYTAKGNALTRVDPSISGTTALTDFADSVWSNATITARGAVIYNDDTVLPVADASCVVLDFGVDRISSAGDFTAQFPAADAANAVIRIT